VSAARRESAPGRPDPDQRAPAPPASDADDLLTVAEVCAWFKVQASWVYDEVQADRLPFVRLGRQHLRFRRGDLRAFLAARTRQPVRRTRAPRDPNGGLEPLD
jgi:excisionase family DNA binding protein